MIITDLEVNRSLARLATNPDFAKFLQALEDEKNADIAALLQSTNPVLVHQLQGSTQMLVDILQAATLAPLAVKTASLGG